MCLPQDLEHIIIMSSRQLRKLQQQKELEEAARRAEIEAPAEEESEEEPLRPPPKLNTSLFANLAVLDDGEDEEDEEKEVESDHEAVNEPDPTPPPKASKSKKKKKKSKNKAEDKTAEIKREALDEIDAALRDLKLQGPSVESQHGFETSIDPQFVKICELVRIQTQHLKVANEMRNLFGRAALENHDDAGGPIGRGARRQPRGQRQQVDLETALKGHHAPGKGLSEITLRRNTFIQGKDEWPRGTTGGLTMEIVEDSRQIDGTVEFRYVHDKAYQTMQQTFYGLVEIGEPQNLIGFLTKNRKVPYYHQVYLVSNRFPAYHISTLLQVSKIAKDQTDHALSSDLLERALFTFGRASLSLFNTLLAQGKARLDFNRPENRELWLAGYHYIKSLVMKGTYRTAFEWAKLLLSLDPEDDPYCMRLMLHHLAIRAHEFKWLLDLGALTSQQEELPEDKRIVKAAPYSIYHNTPSLGLAALQLKESVKARELLSQSMKRFPWLFVRLFSELNMDPPPSIWGNQTRTDAEDLFTSLYVQQTKDLWNTTEGTAILMEIAHTIHKVHTDLIPVVGNKEMDLDIVRFIYLDNTPALMALVPSHLLHRGNNSDSDPIPPDSSTYSYHIQGLNERDGLQGLDPGFEDPMAALGRLLFRRRMDDGEESDGDHELEDIIRNGIGGLGIDSDGEDDVQDGTQPPSMANRFYNYFFANRNSSPVEGGEEATEDEHTDTDETPDLVPTEHRNRQVEETSEERSHLHQPTDVEDEATDNEMPPLV